MLSPSLIGTATVSVRGEPDLHHRCRHDEERVDSLRGDVDEHHPLVSRTGPSDSHSARSRRDPLTDQLADLVQVHRGWADLGEVVQELLVVFRTGGDADDDDPAAPLANAETSFVNSSTALGSASASC